jgi:carbon storage regulator
MLVLSRRRNEVLYIGDDVTITVLEVINGKVRLGITAPPEVPVYRKEVADRPDGPRGGGPVVPKRLRGDLGGEGGGA